MPRAAPPRSTRSSSAGQPKPAAVPTPANLNEAALRHLARYAATAAGLVRVLDRRVDRWARSEAAEPEAVRTARAAAREVVAKQVAAGLVDDGAFAASRVRNLGKSGHSRRGIAAHLAARGIGAETAHAALPDDPESELVAAVMFTRRRRIGAFAAAAPDADQFRKALGMLARAGFAQDVATSALRMAAEDAEAIVLRLRQS